MTTEELRNLKAQVTWGWGINYFITTSQGNYVVRSLDTDRKWAIARPYPGDENQFRLDCKVDFTRDKGYCWIKDMFPDIVMGYRRQDVTELLTLFPEAQIKIEPYRSLERGHIVNLCQEFEFFPRNPDKCDAGLTAMIQEITRWANTELLAANMDFTVHNRKTDQGWSQELNILPAVYDRDLWTVEMKHLSDSLSSYWTDKADKEMVRIVVTINSQLRDVLSVGEED